MAHQRKLIRAAVAAALTGTADARPTSAADRVFKARKVPYRRRELPAIAIYAKTEPVDPESKATAPRYLTRTLQLVVEIVDRVPENGSMEDRLDDLAEEVERAMDRDPTFGGTCKDSILASTDQDVYEFDGEGRALEVPLGTSVLTYSIEYETPCPLEAEGLGDFETAGIRTSLGGAQAPADQAHDVATVETEP